MHIIYKITYLPHLGTDHPKYYIGSKYNYNGDYLGSVASSRTFEFTRGLKLRTWWRQQTKQHKTDFTLEILCYFDEITTEMLIEYERMVQINLDVRSNDYFNQCFANRGFFASERSKETKQKTSISTKSYWDSAAGKEKKLRMSERNRQIKPKQMSERWDNPTEKMIEGAISGGKKNRKQIEFHGFMFDGWKDLKERTGISIHKYNAHYASGEDPMFEMWWGNIDVMKILERLQNEDSSDN